MSWLYEDKPNHPMAQLKTPMITRKGLNTVRMGWRSVENGAPIVPRKDKPAWRSRDGSQIGPYYAEPAAPWNVHIPYQPRQSSCNPALPASSLLPMLQQNPQFRQGYPYPYGSEDYSYHRVIYPKEYISTNPNYRVPQKAPSQHEPKPDAIRLYLPKGRL